eukprot:m51a1_g14290 hypothetical protein (646) ;mRNA; f:403387-405324
MEAGDLDVEYSEPAKCCARARTDACCVRGLKVAFVAAFVLCAVLGSLIRAGVVHPPSPSPPDAQQRWSFGLLGSAAFLLVAIAAFAVSSSMRPQSRLSCLAACNALSALPATLLGFLLYFGVLSLGAGYAWGWKGLFVGTAVQIAFLFVVGAVVVARAERSSPSHRRAAFLCAYSLTALVAFVCLLGGSIALADRVYVRAVSANATSSSSAHVSPAPTLHSSTSEHAAAPEPPDAQYTFKVVFLFMAGIVAAQYFVSAGLSQCCGHWAPFCFVHIVSVSACVVLGFLSHFCVVKWRGPADQKVLEYSFVVCAAAQTAVVLVVGAVLAARDWRVEDTARSAYGTQRTPVSGIASAAVVALLLLCAVGLLVSGSLVHRRTVAVPQSDYSAACAVLVALGVLFAVALVVVLAGSLVYSVLSLRRLYPFGHGMAWCTPCFCLWRCRRGKKAGDCCSRSTACASIGYAVLALAAAVCCCVATSIAPGSAAAAGASSSSRAGGHAQSSSEHSTRTAVNVSFVLYCAGFACVYTLGVHATAHAIGAVTAIYNGFKFNSWFRGICVVMHLLGVVPCAVVGALMMAGRIAWDSPFSSGVALVAVAVFFAVLTAVGPKVSKRLVQRDAPACWMWCSAYDDWSDYHRLYSSDVTPR